MVLLLLTMAVDSNLLNPHGETLDLTLERLLGGVNVHKLGAQESLKILAESSFSSLTLIWVR